MMSLKEFAPKIIRGLENMSQMIHMEWECPSCQRHNLQLCQKPSLYRASLFTTSCLLCAGSFLIKVMKPQRMENQVSYVILSGSAKKLTADEIENLIQKQLTSAKAEKTQGENENGNTTTI